MKCDECGTDMHRFETADESGWSCDTCGWSTDDAPHSTAFVAHQPTAGVACPNCRDTKLVGRIEIHERCVDVLTGDAIRDETINECARYECGRCSHEWHPDADEPHPLECPQCGDDINKCRCMSDEYVEKERARLTATTAHPRAPSDERDG